ncbi:MAG: hypothetical protein IJ561_02670 [Ruminococcus sp.]|nr:hypothetical protein [Ruminococcus sp.]
MSALKKLVTPLNVHVLLGMAHAVLLFLMIICWNSGDISGIGITEGFSAGTKLAECIFAGLVLLTDIFLLIRRKLTPFKALLCAGVFAGIPAVCSLVLIVIPEHLL